MNVYAVNLTPCVWQTVPDYCVNLRIVPAGATGSLQPIDHCTFGELKSTAQAEFSCIAMSTGTMTVDCHELRTFWRNPGMGFQRKT
jgi:hypothetical protein